MKKNELLKRYVIDTLPPFGWSPAGFKKAAEENRKIVNRQIADVKKYGNELLQKIKTIKSLADYNRVHEEFMRAVRTEIFPIQHPAGMREARELGEKYKETLKAEFAKVKAKISK